MAKVVSTLLDLPLPALTGDLTRDLVDISEEELEYLRDPQAEPESQGAAQVCEETGPAELRVLGDRDQDLGVEGENQTGPVLTSLLGQFRPDHLRGQTLIQSS